MKKDFTHIITLEECVEVNMIVRNLEAMKDKGASLNSELQFTYMRKLYDLLGDKYTTSNLFDIYTNTGATFQ